MVFCSSAIIEIWGEGRKEAEQIYGSHLKYDFSSDSSGLNCFSVLSFKVQETRRCRKERSFLASNCSL